MPRESAAALDARDPLAAFRSRFVGAGDPALPAYLDGNSLGRPVASVPARLAQFAEEQWGGRLIRGWDESWFDLPLTLGDRIARATLGAAPGQTAVADSTTVSLYKLVRAARALRPGRDEIVIDRGNFPTDRFVVQGIAAETGASIRWIDTEQGSGVTLHQVREVVGARTAVVVLSQVAFRSGHLADVPGITSLVHEHGALVLWDLCHSVGAVPIELDAWQVDFATGCTYKYLNGGPGAPSFLYVAERHLGPARQPIQGWMGDGDPFAMAVDYRPATGIRSFLSGTPSIVGMIAMQEMLALIEEAGIEAIRTKSLALTEFAIELVDEQLAPYGVELSTPRDAAERGSHVTIDHPAFVGLTGDLWERGLIPDFRPPTGLRLGLSPLSTSFAEVQLVIDAVAGHLRAIGG